MLSNKVAIVTGATRGAGKGIALALGDAGATVYVTGRTSRSGPAVAAPLQQSGNTAPGSVEETAAEVTRRGGTGIPVICAHTDDAQVSALFERVEREQGGRLDLLVNAVWGGNELPIDVVPFWDLPLQHWDNMFTAGVRCALTASQKAAALMVAQGSGLIVNVTAWDDDKYTGQFMYDLAKASLNRMAFGMAVELHQHKVAALAVAPGWMRTERVLDAFGCVIDTYDSKAAAAPAGVASTVTAHSSTPGVLPDTEGSTTAYAVADTAGGAASGTTADTAGGTAAAAAGGAPLKHWTEVPDLKATESPMYLGRAVAALAADPVGALAYSKEGKVLRVADLARQYGFTDLDGTQPARFVL